MAQTRFSQRLALLMKERKISGQKIADAIGKSQKTISRYVNGEIDPSNEVKNAIYKAIASISGIEDDAMTEEELDEEEIFLEMSTYFSESDNDAFAKLSNAAKEYYSENLEDLILVEEWEDDVLNFYHKLSSTKQEEMANYLDNFNFTYKSVKNTEKLAAYMRMIERSNKRPVILINDEAADKKSDEEFYKKVKKMGVKLPSHPYFLSYGPYDWYLLLRINIYELYDDKQCRWDEKTDNAVGVKLAHLLNAMKI